MIWPPIQLAGPTLYKTMLLGICFLVSGPCRRCLVLVSTSRRTIPADSSCWPMLNWNWVMPTSRRKKSVNALPLMARIQSVHEQNGLWNRGRRTHILPLSSCREKKPRMRSGMMSKSTLFGLCVSASFLTSSGFDEQCHTSAPGLSPRLLSMLFPDPRHRSG